MPDSKKNAETTIVGTSGTKTYAIGFPLIKQDYLLVEVFQKGAGWTTAELNGAAGLDYTVDAALDNITMVTGPATGDLIRMRRTTPHPHETRPDPTEPPAVQEDRNIFDSTNGFLSDFTDGAVITAADMLQMQRQHMHYVEEVEDKIVHHRYVAGEVTTAAIAQGREDVLLVDTTSNIITVTLLDPADYRSRVYTVKKANSGTNGVVVLPSSGTIDKQPGVLLAGVADTFPWVTLVSDGASNWWVTAFGPAPSTAYGASF